MNYDHIVKVLKTSEGVAGLDRHRPYIDMELCEFNLEDYINDLTSRFAPARGQDFYEKQVWNIIGQITTGLDFIHSNGYVHRDLKPMNSSIP